MGMESVEKEKVVWCESCKTDYCHVDVDDACGAAVNTVLSEHIQGKED
jgi:hypothetical protein